jgi:hypothetical protein
MTDYRRTDPKDWPRPTPRHKDVMADMSEDMQRFLRAATISGVRPEDVGLEPDKSFHLATLAALKRHGLVHLVQTKKRRQLWRPTDDGRGVAMRHEPRLLRARPGALRFRTLPNGRQVVDETATGEGDYTSEPRRAMRGEPECIDRAA